MKIKKEEKKSVITEYERIKKEFKELSQEEKNLRDYLNINVFNYAQNSQQMEDIFAINRSAMAFLETDKNTHKVNPNIPVLEINNLTKYYSSRKIPSLLNVTIKVYLGDIHVIVGSSGSGKTTLFNCLQGIEDYDGNILVDGKELQINKDFDHTQIIGFVPTEISWDLYATVEEVISNRFQEFNLTDIEVKNYIRSSLEQLNISYLRHYYVIDLTLLEKRKLQIVLALITDPHVIVLDDIFQGLQQHEIFDLLTILHSIKRNDRAIVILAYAFDFCTRIANSVTVLSEGSVYYTGLAKHLFLDKLHRYSINTSDNKRANDILKFIKGCKYTYSEIMDTFFVEFDGELTLKTFQQECLSEDIFIKEMRTMETRLEDLYPVLKTKGNKESIKRINAINYFTVF